MNILSIYIGYIIDLIIGDPYSFPHPVRFIGKLIKITEDQIRKVAKNDKALKIGGFILWFITVGVTYFVTYLIVKLSSLIPGGFLIANSFLIYTTLATYLHTHFYNNLNCIEKFLGKHKNDLNKEKLLVKEEN